jgi:DNA-binding NtrC family response regulator
MGDRTRTLKIPHGSAARSDAALRIGERTFAAASVVVGRGEGTDLRIDDATVSQFHVELTPGPDGVRVRDLGSRNGTRAGGVRIFEAMVDWGTELSLGSAKLTLERAQGEERRRASQTSFGGLVGSSDVMRELYALLDKLAPTELSVLIEGETGTGKEVCARALHDASKRSAGPFVTVDCTTIPRTLAESVLFGHERGAFTGATEKRAGLLEIAAGGTLFLDELGELPLDLQPKLLGALERREIVPVGSTKRKSIDVRVLAATLRDLRTMVNGGAFREDLYFRVAQARVHMPSLEERPEDVPALVQHFLAAIPFDVHAARGIAQEALHLICARPFRGNVRELKSTVERVAMIAEGATITEADLAFERVLVTKDRSRDVEAPNIPAPRALSTNAGSPSEDIEPFKDAKRTAVDEFERGYLERLVQRTGLNISRAATVAGVERETLRTLLRKHGLHEAKDKD